MSRPRTSLSGSWSGAFRYPHGPRETVFNARIEEVGGAFVGSTEEPNEFAPGAGAVLVAEIEGVRSGNHITFTKFYAPQAGVGHAVRYEGSANSDLTRIEGGWVIHGDW